MQQGFGDRLAEELLAQAQFVTDLAREEKMLSDIFLSRPNEPRFPDSRPRTAPAYENGWNTRNWLVLNTAWILAAVPPRRYRYIDQLRMGCFSQVPAVSPNAEYIFAVTHTAQPVPSDTGFRNSSCGVAASCPGRRGTPSPPGLRNETHAAGYTRGDVFAAPWR